MQHLWLFERALLIGMGKSFDSLSRSLKLKQFEHRVSDLISARLCKFFREDLIKLPLENFLSLTTVKIGGSFLSAPERGEHLGKERLSNEVVKRLSQFFLLDILALSSTIGKRFVGEWR